MPAPDVIEKMLGTWGLEPQTSTVSTPEFEVNRCTYEALVATKKCKSLLCPFPTAGLNMLR
jgi:hypothetical protein